MNIERNASFRLEKVLTKKLQFARSGYPQLTRFFFIFNSYFSANLQLVLLMCSMTFLTSVFALVFSSRRWEQTNIKRKAICNSSSVTSSQVTSLFRNVMISSKEMIMVGSMSEQCTNLVVWSFKNLFPQYTISPQLTIAFDIESTDAAPKSATNRNRMARSELLRSKVISN